MENNSNFEYRFGGIGRLLSVESSTNIKKSHVMVIGLGGVGSWAAEALVRSGLGRITLVDFDEVCFSNINRQLLATTSTVGKMKTQVLKDRFLDINPELEVNIIEEFFDDESYERILNLNPVYILDAIDSLKNKCLLVSECRKRNIPLIVSGGAGGLTDPTKIQLTDLSQSFSDPLLQSLRKRLRQEFGFPRGDKKFGVPCVFSSESQSFPQDDGSVTKDPAQKPTRRLDCQAGLGTATFITGTFGFFAAAYVVRALAETNKS